MEKVISDPSNTKKILNKYNFNLKKKLGQNLLVDSNILDKITAAATLKKADTVVEIGPGIGSLTQKVLSEVSSGKLIAIEKDRKFIKILNDLFEDVVNLELINKDVRDIDWTEFLKSRGLEGKEVTIMGNLPYYITTPIIMELLENEVVFKKLVFMVQKEVAERIVANPGSKDFGALSVGVQFHSQVNIIDSVSPRVFIPQPRVDSSIITFEPFSKPPFEVHNKTFFFKVVKNIFQLRRKNIKNSLTKASAISLKKQTVLKALEICNIDQKIRGEKLTIAKMVHLSNTLWDIINERSDNNEIYQSY